MAVLPAPVWVPSQRPLARSVTSVMLVTNDKGDNEMILGGVHRSPGIPLRTGKFQKKIKGPCNQSLPQMGSLLRTESLGGREKERRK